MGTFLNKPAENSTPQAGLPPVAICICTCGRPTLLRRTLGAIAKLDYAGDLRVVVMDNHHLLEGYAICAELSANYRWTLIYGHEPRPGLAFARNAVLARALAEPVEFIAMIDDDEWPRANWLSRLIATQQRTGAHVVAGLVEPEFEHEVPDWMVKGSYFRRTAEAFSTGNMLISAEALRREGGNWFDPKLNFLGNEDYEMVASLRARGFACVAENDAIVDEWVPASRATLNFILARGMREGNAFIFAPELRGPGWKCRWDRLACFGMKFVHACHHLVRSLVEGWRFYRGLDDLASFYGMGAGLLGYRYMFYASYHGATRRFVRIGKSESLSA